jgi:peptidoglycan hydrolase-like protein with peptidoglycan-binding domain
VTELQKRLAAEGVYTGPITGTYASLSSAGVKAYQKKYGIEQTGTVGPKTRIKLNSTTCTAPLIQIIQTTTPTVTTAIKLGSKGDEVMKLQAKLKAEGVYVWSVTGNFGALTKEALKAYQAKKGLPVTGELDTDTLAALNV